MATGWSVLACTLTLAAVTSPARADAQAASRPLDDAVVDYEAGVLAILQNDGRYGAGGTEFTARDTNQRDNLVVASRLSIEGRRGRHRAVLLYAPLDVTTRVRLQSDLQFRDQMFAGGQVVDHRYLFDGYRGSYLYRLVDGAVELEVGGSLQIRNARVAFTAVDGSGYDQESDIGVVPAVKARLTYRGPRGAYGMLDADGSSTFGLVGDTSGGLYDVGLTLGLPLASSVDLFVRARGVGGGATVPKREIDNWAHFLAFTAGVRVNLTALR